jgi:hypothetical protein
MLPSTCPLQPTILINAPRVMRTDPHLHALMVHKIIAITNNISRLTLKLYLCGHSDDYGYISEILCW